MHTSFRPRIRAGTLLSSGVALAGFFITACGGAATSGSSNSTAAASTGGQATVGTTQTNLGTVLAGPDGKTLYVLLDSQMHPVACSASCMTVWPPLTTSGAPQADSGVTAKLATTSASGATLVTANSDPLYSYTGDSGPGQTNGEGINSYGGTWFVIQANGQPLTSAGSSSPSASSSSSSSGGGYGY